MDRLTEAAKARGRTAARIAAEIVLDAIGKRKSDHEADHPGSLSAIDEERLDVAREAVDRLLRGLRGDPAVLREPELARLKLIEQAAEYLAAARGR